MAAAAAGDGAAVTALTVDQTVLNVFWELASVQTEKREAAAKQLVDALSRAQQEFDASRTAADAAAPHAAAPLVSYSLRRLTRGLGSGREGARQGFALAFTGALTALPCVSAKAAVDILNTHSEPVTGSAKGSEAREIYLGKLFGYGAIARSMRESAASDARSASVIALLAQEVCVLARMKGYLREAGAAVLLQLLEGINSRTLGAVLEEAPAFAEWLFSPVETADAEALYLALELADRLPASVAARCALLPPAGVSRLFDKVHLAALLPALLSSTAAHPRVHSVWTSLTKLLAKRAERPAAAPADPAVETFWDVACENSLFASSHERKYLGFKLFTTLLPTLHVSDVPVLFSPQFMRCLVNSLTNKDTLLHASASLCLSNLLEHVQSDAGAALQTSVIAALQRFAGGRFDRLTHTGAIASLMERLEPESAEDYVGTLFSSFLSGTPVGQQGEARAADDADDAGDAERSVTGRRVWAIEQLCGLCRSPRTPAAVHLRVMRFLQLHAFFEFVPGCDASAAKLEEVKLGAPSPALTADVRQLCATRLAGLLADALAAAQAQVRSAGVPDTPAAEAALAEATARKQRAVECAGNLDALVDVTAKVERAHAHLALVQPLPADAAAVRKAVRALLPTLDRLAAGDAAGARSETSTQADAVRVLLRVLLILQLGAPDDYSGDMEDLPRCLQAAFAASGSFADAPAPADSGEEPPHHMDVLVEVLLSLLAKPSAVLRDVVERVFRAFAVGVTAEGVRSMLRVVARSKDRRHSAVKDDSDASDDDSDGEGSEDGESDAAEEEEEEEMEEDGDDDGDEQTERQNSQQHAARAAADSDGEDSDDGAGMDDDAMFRADSALAAVLSLSKAAKSKKKAAAEALTHFKFRVLSLLDTFIKAQPASPAVPSMVLPLLRALIAVVQGAAASDALADRIAGLLVKGVCKAPGSGGAATQEQLQSWFDKCFRHASRSTVPKVAKAAVAACQYLLRVMANAGPEGAAAVQPLARAAVADYFASKKCRLPYNFFAHLMERFPAASGAIVEDMTAQIAGVQQKDARNARDDFLTLQALKLTVEALRHKQGSPGAAALATALQPATVLRGASMALTMHFSKAKRQVEVHKQAVQAADALRRFCAGQNIALPAAEVAALRAAAVAAKSADPLPPPKVAAQFDRLLAAFAGAPAGGKRKPSAQTGTEPPRKAKRQA